MKTLQTDAFSKPWRSWVIPLAAIGYISIFILFYLLLGRGVGALAILPVIAIGWVYGARGGIAAAVISLPFNILLLKMISGVGMSVFFKEGGGVAGTVALVFIGGLVGRLSELRRQVRQELVERQRAEEVLRETSQSLLALIKASPLAIVVLDTEGRVTLWNPAAERIFGWGEQEVLGARPPFMGDLSSEPFRKLLNKALHGQEIMDEEIRQRCKNGSAIDIALSAASLLDESGRVNAVMMLMSDITENKHLQKGILQISDREQRRIGQDLHDGLGQSLSGVAFMLRALAQKLGAQSRPEAETASEITKLVNETISQARGLSRGLYPIALEFDGLTAAIEELAASTENIFSISCVFTYNVARLEMDSYQAIHLYRIVQEAVNNAVRHGRAGRIDISLEEVSGKLILTVRDDGCGMEEPPGQTMGMGISIMNYRARMVGAAIDIRGIPGEGTVVTCTFAKTVRPETGEE